MCGNLNYWIFLSIFLHCFVTLRTFLFIWNNRRLGWLYVTKEFLFFCIFFMGNLLQRRNFYFRIFWWGLLRLIIMTLVWRDIATSTKVGLQKKKICNFHKIFLCKPGHSTVNSTPCLDVNKLIFIIYCNTNKNFVTFVSSRIQTTSICTIWNKRRLLR